MWQSNNGFGNNGQYQNDFNQDGYPPAFPGQPLPGQPHYFSQHSNMMQYEETNNGEGFQPEVGLYNDGAFLQNKLVNGGAQFSPPAFVPQTITPRPPAQISARAAELKAQLLQRQLEGRASSATPPVLTNLTNQPLAAKQIIRGEGSSSLRASPKIPTTIAEKHEQEQNVNDLISQYSVAKPAEASVKQENTNPNKSSLQRIPVNTGAKSQAPSLGSPTNVTKPVTLGTNTGNQVDHDSNGKYLGNRHTSNGSVSEGEILEEKEPTPKPAPATKSKETQSGGKVTKANQPVSRKIREERGEKSNSLPRPRDESPPRRPPPGNPRTQVQRNRDDRHEETDTRPEKRAYETYQPDYKNERKQYHETERPTYQRREIHEEDYRRAEPMEQRREEVINRPSREQKPYTLNDLLPLDEDLREWLEITGYHNAPYRSKILSRRRAIAALDAKRDQLLAEMEAEERGGMPAAIGSQMPVSSMLPPPIPNKVGGRVDSLSMIPVGETGSDSQRDRVASNKRPYSDVYDSRNEPNGGKVARTDDRGYVPPRVEEEEQRRPRSSGFDTGRRSPTDRRERETSRPRYEQRGRSRERDSSPGRRAFEHRPPARGRGYDMDNAYERDDAFDRGSRVETRGNYRGRAYDPNYRGRGRGRGRGESRDSRDFYNNSDSKSETGFGSKIANGKPYRDPKGFDRGGRGETRYFIVKSFNEENVLRCIQDSVWTTQVQNGSIFKEAFETCKNVILVFSINKSRAFQGYARMESLPGSVEVPEWQRAINWESTGAFKVKWLVICATRFHRIGHLKNSLNDNMAVLIGKDGQEIEENCGADLIELIDEEVNTALGNDNRYDDRMWDDTY